MPSDAMGEETSPFKNPGNDFLRIFLISKLIGSIRLS